jgi:hypothetical protein
VYMLHVCAQRGPERYINTVHSWGVDHSSSRGEVGRVSVVSYVLYIVYKHGDTGDHSRGCGLGRLDDILDLEQLRE